MTRVLVCGGRLFDDYGYVFASLTRAHKQFGFSVLIQGGARGADTFARNWAYTSKVPQLEFPADWDTHGKSAGPIRNQQMIREGKPDLVIAFPGGNGTANMIQQARAAGIRVIEMDGMSFDALQRGEAIEAERAGAK